MTMLSINPRTYFAAVQSGHPSFAVDALIAFVLVILALLAMILTMALLGGAEPALAVANAGDGVGMLILPP